MYRYFVLGRLPRRTFHLTRTALDYSVSDSDLTSARGSVCARCDDTSAEASRSLLESLIEILAHAERNLGERTTTRRRAEDD